MKKRIYILILLVLTASLSAQSLIYQYGNDDYEKILRVYRILGDTRLAMKEYFVRDLFGLDSEPWYYSSYSSDITGNVLTLEGFEKQVQFDVGEDASLTSRTYDASIPDSSRLKSKASQIATFWGG